MGSSDPVPSRAFMGSAETNVVNAIARLAKEQRHMTIRDLSIEDLRQLFIPAALRDPLKVAFEHASNPMEDQYITAKIPAWEGTKFQGNEYLTASFVWDYNETPEGFFAPKKRRDGGAHLFELQLDVSPEILERWEYVSMNLARISYQWGMVKKVFSELNTHGFCNTPQQMRFVWPVTKNLVEKAELKDLARQLIEPSPRAGDRARIPPHIGDLIVPTVTIVNATTLIEAPNLNEKRDFRLEMNNPAYVVEAPRANNGFVMFDGMR